MSAVRSATARPTVARCSRMPVSRIEQRRRAEPRHLSQLRAPRRIERSSAGGRTTSARSALRASSYSATPVAVSGITNAVSIATGFLHTCALLARTARCDAGDTTTSASLATGRRPARRRPCTVQGIVNPLAISLGIGHTCALMPDASRPCAGARTILASSATARRPTR